MLRDPDSCGLRWDDEGNDIVRSALGYYNSRVTIYVENHIETAFRSKSSDMATWRYWIVMKQGRAVEAMDAVP